MLTPDEDEELRRINVLSQFGELPETMQSRFRELLHRADRVGRLDIPEPTLDVQLLPRQRVREDAADNDDDGYESVLDAVDESLYAELAPTTPGFVKQVAYLL